MPKKPAGLGLEEDAVVNPFADVPSATVQQVADMATRAAGPKRLTMLGRQFVLHGDSVVDARELLKPHKVATLALGSLAGVIDYLEANIDELAMDELAVLVQGPDQVFIVGAIGEAGQRQTYASVKLVGEPFPFGRYLDQQSFVIGLMTQFEDSAARAALVAMASKIVQGEQVEAEDDGVGQTVTVQARAGIKERTTPQVIHLLAPFRTFREAEQPESPFLLRVRGEKDAPPSLALFEADGGQWRNTARENVQSWLEEKLIEVESLKNVKVLA